MKRDFHIHFYSRIIFAVAILAMVLFLSQRSVQTRAILVNPMEIYGWAYASTTGWISLNCNNDVNGDGIGDNTCNNVDSNGNVIDYKLQVRSEGAMNTVTGCAWSGSTPYTDDDSSLGWLCFSDDYNSSTFNRASTEGMRVLLDKNWIISGGDNSFPSFTKIEHSSPASDSFLNYYPSNPVYYPNEDLPAYDRPIDGCFNCFSEPITKCSNCSTPPCDPCTTTADCDGYSCVEVAGVKTCSGGPLNGESCSQDSDCGVSCITVGQKNFCDNCLKYVYYRGHCSDDINRQCDRDGDCAGGTCLEQFTCSNARSTPCPNGIGDCPPRLCTDNVTGCDEDSDCPGKCTGSQGICWADNECPVGQICARSICPVLSCDSRPVGSIQKTIAGFTCSDCTIASMANRCDASAYGYNKNRCEKCGFAAYNPGLILDSEHNRASSALICGWGYNDEIGWVWFSPKISTSTKPYINVEGGSIYSKNSVFSRYTPPLGKYNASYLIESGGTITNFVSSSTLHGIFQGELHNRPLINYFLPTPNSLKYRNVLGAIDYQGIITKYSNDVNKYGSTVETITGANLSNFASYLNSLFYLGGRTFYFPEAPPLEIKAEIHINVDQDKLASGVIVVNGNLNITNNIIYESLSTVYNLKEIPSLVWIVRGDVRIGPGVSNLAGTFVVLGNGTSCEDHRGDTPPGPGPVAGCGQFISCDTTLTPSISCGANFLTVDGSILAKRFELGRTRTDANATPSESFINNGRMQANPPPGLMDFGQLLPRFIDQ
ncbi:MAG: hypothetical protein C3F02_03330 [Parcubacteria group bacterium]|nr:MAG: hypothetical protein C3F02_03330 [Parcubacteria group bacterium]